VGLDVDVVCPVGAGILVIGGWPVPVEEVTPEGLGTPLVDGFGVTPLVTGVLPLGVFPVVPGVPVVMGGVPVVPGGVPVVPGGVPDLGAGIVT